jgi:hypothetical protein
MLADFPGRRIEGLEGDHATAEIRLVRTRAVEIGAPRRDVGALVRFSDEGAVRQRSAQRRIGVAPADCGHSNFRASAKHPRKNLDALQTAAQTRRCRCRREVRKSCRTD